MLSSVPANRRCFIYNYRWAVPAAFGNTPEVALRGSAGKDILSESGYERQIQEYGERKRQRNCQRHGERERQQWRQIDLE